MNRFMHSHFSIVSQYDLPNQVQLRWNSHTSLRAWTTLKPDNALIKAFLPIRTSSDKPVDASQPLTRLVFRAASGLWLHPNAELLRRRGRADK
jgi:hypothetical protein